MKRFSHEARIRKISAVKGKRTGGVKVKFKNTVLMRCYYVLSQECFLQQVSGYMQAENHECSWEPWEGNWKLHTELSRNLPLCMHKCADMQVIMLRQPFSRQLDLETARFCSWKKGEITFSAKDGIIVFIVNEVDEVVRGLHTLFLVVMGIKWKFRLKANGKAMKGSICREFGGELPDLTEKKLL